MLKANPHIASARGARARQLRIIAGRWRARRWRFPEGEIRPTSDRVRETLFNWLQGRTQGLRCLDLYAGSGALGLEALSRGAAECVFVDQDARVGAMLRELWQAWGVPSGAGHFVHADATRFLSGPARLFDLVFLDPPFAAAALGPVATRLESGGWLAPGALIYLEHPRSAALAALAPPLPPDWRVLRQGTAGAVGYDLLVRP